MALDLNKLQNVRAGSNGSTTAACPCCRTDFNRDQTGNHLIIYPDGRFGCAANPDDAAHRSRIWALAGKGSSGDGGEAPVERTKQLTLPRTYPIETLDRLIKDYSYWATRGISASTVEPFRGGVATQGQMRQRFVIPIFNATGEIIGFNGRRIDGKPDMKWKILGQSSTFVWGGLAAIKSTRRAILVESMGDAFSCIQNGIPEVLCLFGINISPAVLGILIALNPERIIVAPNNDIKHKVGQNAAAEIRSTILSFFDSKNVEIQLPIQKDFGEMSAVEFEKWKIQIKR